VNSAPVHYSFGKTADIQRRLLESGVAGMTFWSIPATFFTVHGENRSVEKTAALITRPAAGYPSCI
jgi:hypothetical protein